MSFRIRRWALTAFAAFPFAALALPTTAVAAQTTTTPTCPVPTSTQLRDHFDTSMPALLDELRLPGAVVSVSAGGTTAFAEGYGLADVERGVAFAAARTLGGVGSVTKLLTWTAVMQQVQAGRLDLNADVNTYLTEFAIPDTFPTPVTVADLMDHTSGLEDASIATYARTPADVEPFAEYLASHMPARVRPPGQVTAYSNYGAGLAGYLVSLVSGQPYDAYIRDRILAPLGMTRSSVTQPLPANLAGDLAVSYDSYADPARPLPHVFDQMPPDGALSATATDMAAFMTAHLHDGGAILSPAATALMHAPSFAADPRLAGYAHGFQQRTINGHRVLMHDGGEEGFRSALMLVPDCDLGVFISMNGTSGEEAAAAFIDGFFGRFVPAQEPAPFAAPHRVGALTVARPEAGFYLTTRHNESTVEKVANLLGTLRLTVADDGHLRFRGRDWQPQGDGLYRTAEGDRMVVLASPDGHIYLATDGPAYQLVPAGETLPITLVVLLVVLLPALGALALPVLRLLRRSTATRTWRLARHLAVGSAVLNITFLAALFAVLTGDTDEFLYRVPPAFVALLVMPIVGLLAGVGALVPTVLAWRGASITGRIHQVALFVGLAAFAWFVWQWHLIGWQYA